MWILKHKIIVHVNKLGFICGPYVCALSDLPMLGNMRPKLSLSTKENSDVKK